MAGPGACPPTRDLVSPSAVSSLFRPPSPLAAKAPRALPSSNNPPPLSLKKTHRTPPPSPPFLPTSPHTVADNLIEKEDLVSLDNGCVCCSLRKDVVKALMTIARRAEQRGKQPDHVILETTGLADPAPVAFTFLSNPWVAARFVVDAIM